MIIVDVKQLLIFFLPRSSLGSTIGGCNNKQSALQIWGAMPYKERSLNIVLKEISSRCKKGKNL